LLDPSNDSFQSRLHHAKNLSKSRESGGTEVLTKVADTFLGGARREEITQRLEAFKSMVDVNPAQIEVCVMNGNSSAVIPSWKNFPRAVLARKFGRWELKLARKFC
jgi:hypothetical protein